MQKYRYAKITAAALLVSSIFIQPVFAQENQQSSYATPWGYIGKVGPEQWGKLNPDFAVCSTGQNQSPINIQVKKTVPSNQNPLQITYNSAPLEIVVDGTRTVTVGNQTINLNDGHAVQVNFAADGPQEAIVFNGDTYHLIQFHFHTPAENELDNHRYPAELHLVHQAPGGKLAVIGVFLKPGAANPTLEKILTNLPKAHDQVVDVSNAYINPADLLPKDNKSYYTFAGSLTTPPCSEGVQWIVMAQPIEASTSQIQELRKAISANNDRPVQPLNGRQVERVTSH